jgi:hypothetical protein
MYSSKSKVNSFLLPNALHALYSACKWIYNTTQRGNSWFQTLSRYFMVIEWRRIRWTKHKVYTHTRMKNAYTILLTANLDKRRWLEVSGSTRQNSTRMFIKGNSLWESGLKWLRTSSNGVFLRTLRCHKRQEVPCATEQLSAYQRRFGSMTEHIKVIYVQSYNFSTLNS